MWNLPTRPKGGCIERTFAYTRAHQSSFVVRDGRIEGQREPYGQMRRGERLAGVERLSWHAQSQPETCGA